MTSTNGRIFNNIDQGWCNLRTFCFRNRSIIEIVFLILYSIEQGSLLILMSETNDTTKINNIVSIFAIIVLTTFGLHKLVMDSRIKWQDRTIQELKDEKKQLTQETQNTIKKYEERLELQDAIIKGASRKRFKYLE